MNDCKGTVALLLTVIIFGSSYAITKVGLEEISPLVLSFTRSFVAFIFLSFLIIIKDDYGEFVKRIKGEWKYFSALGMAGVVMFNIFQNVGVKLTSSALAGTLHNTIPIFILILSWIFLHEIITKNKIIGVLTGLVGVCIIVFVGKDFTDMLHNQTIVGNALVLGSAVMWAAYTILNKNVSKHYNPLYLTTSAYIFGSIFLLPVAASIEDIGTLASLSMKTWAIVLYLGIFCSGITFLLWNYALSRMDSTKASVFIYLIPIVAMLVGWAFMGETITIYMIIGFALTIIGIFISGKNSS